MKKLIIVLAIAIGAASVSGCTGAPKSTASQASSQPSSAAAESSSALSEEQAVSKLVNKNELVKEAFYADQAETGTQLMAELEAGYSFDEPLVVVNPYGNAPLTGLVLFTTEGETGGTITVKGHTAQDDIGGAFPKATKHVVPIYGLYPNELNKVELTLDSGESVLLEVQTDAVKTTATGVEIKTIDESRYDYTTLKFVTTYSGEICAFDSKGELRWFYGEGGCMDLTQLENGHFLVPSNFGTRGFGSYHAAGVKEIDLLGKVYTEYIFPDDMHHDTVEMPNGNLLMASSSPNFTPEEDTLIEVDRKTGEIVWSLDMKELIDPTDGGSINSTEKDWLHINAVSYDPQTDTIYLSGRHVDGVVAVKKETKELLWILGDPDGWTKVDASKFFTPEGDGFEWQYAQHQSENFSDNRILLFDNGAGRTKTTKPDQKVAGSDVYSRAVLYQIDPENMTVKQQWSYGKERGEELYCSFMSGVVPVNLEENNFLITFGTNLYNPQADTYDAGQYMADPETKKAAILVQAIGADNVFEMKIDGILAYRTALFNMYDAGMTFDLTTQAERKGHFRELEGDIPEVDLKSAQALPDGVTFSLEDGFLRVSGKCPVETAEEEKIYLLMSDGEQAVKSAEVLQVSAMFGGVSEKSLHALVSTYNLQGNSYDLYIAVGDKVYNTGYFIAL